MKIIYYKSRLCPRCIPTNHLLERVRREHPEIEIEQVEALTHLGRALQDGIHTLPTLIVGARRFTGTPSVQDLMDAVNQPQWNSPLVAV